MNEDLPKIFFTDRAISQINLIIENDYTIANQHLRIEISGKGCEGFHYSIGFDDTRQTDILFEPQAPLNCKLLMDPFATFFIKKANIDFIQDFSQDAEGFVLTNDDQEMFEGKFWRKKPELIPEHLKEVFSSGL